MNAIEALQVARDALAHVESVWRLNIKVEGEPSSTLENLQSALAATAVIEQMAASIDGPELVKLLWQYCDAARPANTADGKMHKALIAHFDQHCAAQVAQEHEAVWIDAGREIDRIAKERDAARAQLADQTDARNLAITERVEITKYCDDLRDQLAQAQAAAQTVNESPQTRMDARPMLLVSVGVERELVARDALTDAEIVEVLHSLGIDTYPSKYNFPEVQVSSTNIPLIRRVVESCIARLDSRVTAVIDPQPSADDARVPDLSRLVARLMRELKKADPAHELPMKAMDYLTRHDLIGSPLRADGPLIDEATRAPDAEVIAELLAALRCALCMMNDECYSDEYTVEFAKVRAAIAHAEGRAA